MATSPPARRQSLRARTNPPRLTIAKDMKSYYDGIVGTSFAVKSKRQSMTTPSKSSALRENLKIKIELTDVADKIVKGRGKQSSPGSSSSSNASNIENDEIQARNESTPKVNRLSKNRRNKLLGLTPCYQSSPSSDGKLGVVLRKIPESKVELSTPTKKLPLRESRRKITESETELLTPKRKFPARESRTKNKQSAEKVYEFDDSQTDSDEEETPKQKTRGKLARGSYFTNSDNEDYVPTDVSDENNDSERGDDDSTDEKNEDEKSPSSDESDYFEASASEAESDIDVKMKGNLATPKSKKLISKDMMTPDLLKKVQGRAVKRMAVDSPLAGSFTMSPNPESYFLAETRIKYRKRAKVSLVPNDAMKGKRKGRRQKLQLPNAQDKLPEMELPTNFSVTAEAMKATVDPQNFISGNTHDDQVDLLLRNIVDNQFPDWLDLFEKDFNIMIYGYGSKLPIFREFENKYGEEHLIVRVNGLFPKLNPKKFLYGIYEHIVSGERSPHGSNLDAVARKVVDLLNAKDNPDVFILVNNFDVMVLRHPQMLNVLCLLGQVSYINILASSDTVNAFLGVTQSQALQLKFTWMHCPTYRQYREELKWTPGIYGDETRSITQKSSLKYVLQSLTGNAKKAFAMLAQMQLKQMRIHANKKSKDVYSGVKFQDLAKECREKFVAHTDDNLRTLLVEFFDHKLISQTGKGRNVENMLLIELDIETLEEIISDLV